MPRKTSKQNKKSTKVVVQVKNQPKRKNPKSKRGKLRSRGAMQKLSVPGAKFLKCAYAAPDFQTDPGMGIPDQYSGKVLMRKDMMTANLPLTAGQDTYILVAPTPGVAYWYVQVATGSNPTQTSQWLPVYNSGYFNSSGLAGNTSYFTNDNVTAFRYASSCVGVYPNSNLTQSAGSIQVWKAPLKLEIAERLVAGVANSLQYSISGLESTTVVAAENYTGKFYDGCYSVGTNMQSDFEFTPIVSGLACLPANGITNSEVDSYGQLNGAIGGFGSMQSTIIKITNPTGSVNSAVIKTWNCVEYQVNCSSVLYQYASTSPAYDPIALDMYYKIKSALPVAVTAAQNAGFWERVLGIVSRVSKALSFVPGPFGAIAGGVNTITSGIQELAM